MSANGQSTPFDMEAPPEVEKFMALLIASQRTRHNCPWCNYFRKMGEQFQSSHIPEKWLKTK